MKHITSDSSIESINQQTNKVGFFVCFGFFALGTQIHHTNPREDPRASALE